MTSRFCVGVLTAAAIVAASTALRQAYPDRPVPMIVPIAVGGPTDTVRRLIARSLKIH